MLCGRRQTELKSNRTCFLSSQECFSSTQHTDSSMDETAQRVLENLTEVEAAAEDILSDKQQVFLNDKRSAL